MPRGVALIRFLPKMAAENLRWSAMHWEYQMHDEPRLVQNRTRMQI